MMKTDIKNSASFISHFAIHGLISLMLVLFLFIQNSAISQSNLQTPQVDSISINQDGRTIISWFQNNDNTKGYVVQRLRPDNTWLMIDTVWGIEEKSYIDLSQIVDPCNNFLIYNVFAVAPGEQPFVSAWSENLQTIYLNQPQHDICANTISLNWTEYINMVQELDRYQILASTDGDNFVVIGNTEPDVTSFVHRDPLPNSQYSYKIRAVNEDGTRTSTSCARTIFSRTYPRPDFTNIITSTVEDNSFIRLDWDADQTAPILRFDIERRAANETAFSIVNSFEDLSGYNPPTLLDDPTAEFNAQSYEYRVVMWDSCGQNPVYSQISRTVHLSGEPFPDYTNRLQWNHYEGWDNGVARYNIYRATDNNFVLLDNVPGFTTDYSDDVQAFSGTGGVFTYYVEAIEEGGNNAVSKSNHIVLEMETRVEVPNAFIPGALPPDNEFKPQVSFIAEGSYELMIFNKWGEMIFTTRDTEQGWDGRSNGELQPPGAYVYLIKYRTPEGQNMEKRGTVTILR